MNAKRLRYTAYLLEQLDKPVLWAAKGDYFVDEKGVIIKLEPDTAFDCSGLTMSGVKKVGGPDYRADWNAQRISDQLPCMAAPDPGDFGIYGKDLQHVVHVVVALAGGHILSADGATDKVRSLARAKELGARVRVHQNTAYRRDVPFLGWRRNTFIDD